MAWAFIAFFVHRGIALERVRVNAQRYSDTYSKTYSKTYIDSYIEAD